MKDSTFLIFREVDTRFQFLGEILTRKGAEFERLQTFWRGERGGWAKVELLFMGIWDISSRYKMEKFIHLPVHLFCIFLLFISSVLFFQAFTRCLEPDLKSDYLHSIIWSIQWYTYQYTHILSVVSVVYSNYLNSNYKVIIQINYFLFECILSIWKINLFHCSYFASDFSSFYLQCILDKKSKWEI